VERLLSEVQFAKRCQFAALQVIQWLSNSFGLGATASRIEAFPLRGSRVALLMWSAKNAKPGIELAGVGQRVFVGADHEVYQGLGAPRSASSRDRRRDRDWFSCWAFSGNRRLRPATCARTS